MPLLKKANSFQVTKRRAFARINLLSNLTTPDYNSLITLFQIIFVNIRLTLPSSTLSELINFQESSYATPKNSRVRRKQFSGKTCDVRN